MALETLSSNEILNFLMYDTVFASKFDCNDSSDTTMLPETSLKPPQFGGASVISSSMMQRCPLVGPEAVGKRRNPAMQGRKKRRRRQNVCKNKEEAETQRITHIAVERNRRKLMNEHLAALRSLMPESYVQRVGGLRVLLCLEVYMVISVHFHAFIYLDYLILLGNAEVYYNSLQKAIKWS